MLRWTRHSMKFDVHSLTAAVQLCLRIQKPRAAEGSRATLDRRTLQFGETAQRSTAPTLQPPAFPPLQCTAVTFCLARGIFCKSASAQHKRCEAHRQLVKHAPLCEPACISSSSPAIQPVSKLAVSVLNGTKLRAFRSTPAPPCFYRFTESCVLLHWPAPPPGIALSAGELLESGCSGPNIPVSSCLIPPTQFGGKRENRAGRAHTATRRGNAEEL